MRPPPGNWSVPSAAESIGWMAEAGMADPDGWLDGARDQILAYLHEHGPTTARELGRQVPALRQPLTMAAGTAWEARISAHTRVITLLGFQGEILRARPTGSWVNGAYRYAAADTWLPGGSGSWTSGPPRPISPGSGCRPSVRRPRSI